MCTLLIMVDTTHVGVASAGHGVPNSPLLSLPATSSHRGRRPTFLTGALAAGRAWRIGEDPFHISVMGSAAYEGLQSPRPVPGGQPTDRFLATRATVPYYLGYHGGSMDPKGSLSAFNATKRSLADSYWPAYGALLESVSQSIVFWTLTSACAPESSFTDVHASRSWAIRWRQ